MILSYIPFNGTYERKSTMPIITKAEHMFSTGVFNSYCVTLHFDYRVNPNVAKQINFDIKNIGDLPALRVVDFFNESNPNLLYIQDVTTDGVMPEIKSDLLFKLFDSKNGVLMGQSSMQSNTRTHILTQACKNFPSCFGKFKLEHSLV
jgi:hypothetical protein